MKKLLGFTAETFIETEIREVGTNRLIKKRLPERNLITDAGLLSLSNKAGGMGPLTTIGIMTFCHVGGGTNATKISSGGITFTQAGTTLTSSAGFFTAAMVGGVFKYGTGTAGDEFYITNFTNTTTVTVQVSATVGTPTVGVVWQVQSTALQTLLFATNTYQNNAGDNQTTFGTGTFTHKRTYIVAQQASPYTVNEIGYGSTSALIAGRVVLGSSDVIGTNNFYVVIINVQFTITPNVPTAMGNVGTNFDTTGSAMVETFGVNMIQGGSPPPCFDISGAANNVMAITVATYSQRANTASTSFLPSTPLNLATATRLTVTGAATGGMSRIGTFYAALSRLSGAFSLSTSGQTCFGLALGITSNTTVFFDDKLTTPVVLPSGTFAGTYQFDISWGRSLNN